jgi:ADP-heptose:LPS heptosyltransferase
VFEHLQIYDRRERLLVGTADWLLKAAAGLTSLRTRPASPSPPRRVLLLRLERIGDLLMTLRAIEAVRARLPEAAIHLVVGSWNAPLAALVGGIDTHETLDVPWLARHAAGLSHAALLRRAWVWRARDFDLAINFEPDIRSNVLLALSGASRRVGFASAGGGDLLTEALAFDRASHTAANALRLVEAALPRRGGSEPAEAGRLSVPEDARQEARRVLGTPAAARLIGVHVSGGREVKQWHVDRFAEVATRLARTSHALVVLTGAPEDKALVGRLTSLLPPDVARLDVAGAVGLPVFAALLERFDLFVTGDTGPMHLAAAVGTPIVALFGPSDPGRYGPLSDRAQVITADLWCRPCNRVRLPPERCRGRVPDCLDALDADSVVIAAEQLLRRVAR